MAMQRMKTKALRRIDYKRSHFE